MATLVKCLYCDSYQIYRTTSGRASDVIAKNRAVAGDAPLQMATGTPRILEATDKVMEIKKSR